MNIGKLNKRISYLTSGTFIDDGFGGLTQSVAGTTTETWCSARQLNAKELLSYGLPLNIKTYEFGFHYQRGTNIIYGMKLTYESKEFKVISVIEQNEEQQHIKVIAANQ